MKKILLLFAGIIVITFSGVSQNEASIDSTGKIMNEQIILDINWLSWMNYPSEINLKPTSAEFILSYLHPFFGKKKNFSIAAGLGLSTQNIKYDAYISSSVYDEPTFMLFNDSISFKTNKLTTVFVDIPFEFRLRTKNNIHQKNFKFTFGGRIGYLLKSYHKYAGDEYRFNTGTTTKFKEYNIPYLNKLHYGVFAKIFYGKFGLNVNYSLSTLFEKEFTPEIVPISMGLSMIFI
ncbi:MAG: hypothetical protein J7L46_02150 [Bacteroidales bacterium]|nr:hypothetical protein [Bacteroidales bacterium]